MIYDLDGNRKLAMHPAVLPDGVVTESVLVDCRTGYQIAGHAVANVTIECQHDGDSWVNIETTPISLTPWDGDQEQFNFRFTGEGHVAVSKRQFHWTVARA